MLLPQSLNARSHRCSSIFASHPPTHSPAHPPTRTCTCSSTWTVIHSRWVGVLPAATSGQTSPHWPRSRPRTATTLAGSWAVPIAQTTTKAAREGLVGWVGPRTADMVAGIPIQPFGQERPFWRHAYIQTQTQVAIFDTISFRANTVPPFEPEKVKAEKAFPLFSHCLPGGHGWPSLDVEHCPVLNARGEGVMSGLHGSWGLRSHHIRVGDVVGTPYTIVYLKHT